MACTTLLCVTEDLNDKTPFCAPNTLWWIFLHAIHGFAFESGIVFNSFTRINYHCIRATVLNEWINQDLLPNDWNVGSINQ